LSNTLSVFIISSFSRLCEIILKKERSRIQELEIDRYQDKGSKV
jgi:hypothetical protein